jgi:hypothetical protein
VVYFAGSIPSLVNKSLMADFPGASGASLAGRYKKTPGIFPGVLPDPWSGINR